MRMLAASLLVVLLLSCSKHLPLPEVDLSAPGWTVWTGQALWKPGADRAAIAGDIVLARHSNGDVLISFAKPPVPIFTAQTAEKAWRLDYAYAQKSHTGSGRPPTRFVWFQIPAMLQDSTVPKGWRMMTTADSVWELDNLDTGEHIRLVLDQ